MESSYVNEYTRTWIGSDVYEFVDPDTTVHYLVYSRKNNNAGMGGITPRLNSDGTIMVGINDD